MGSPRRPSRLLAICALSAWVLWLLNLAAMAWYYQVRAGHPSYIPVLGSLSLLALAGVVLLIGAFVRFVRGPDRSRAFGWLLLGITPLLIAATHLSVGAWILFRDHSLSSVPVKLAATAAASTADLVGRYRHSSRTSSKRVLLIHDADDEASQELGPLDEHIARMEKLLGQQPGGREHLFRGPVFSPVSAAGWYLCGVAIVENPLANVGDVDRHELAHAVIDRYCDSSSHPPPMLVEGWAESQSGYEKGYLARRAWDRRCRGYRLDLKAMTSPGWCDTADWHCYEFGGALVDYLLRTYGGRKFFELYSTCRPDTFAADVQRVLGVTLDELDERYWEDISNQIVSAPTSLEGLLMAAPLADGIDRAQWQTFAHEYSGIVRQAAPERGPVVIEQEFSYSRKSDNGKLTVERNELIHAGDRHRLLTQSDDRQELTVATPDVSFLVTKTPLAMKISDQTEWTLAGWDSRGRRPSDYWGNLMWIAGSDGPANGGAEDYRTKLFTQTQAGNNAKSFRINRFEVDSTDPDGIATLEFEFGEPGNLTPGAVTAQFKMHPARQWAVASYEVKELRKEGPTVSTATFTYPADNPASSRPVRREQRVTWPEGELITHLKLLRYEPWKVDEAAFDPASIGIAQADIDARYRTPWYFWCWGAVAPFALLGGIALLVLSRSRPSAGASTSDVTANPQPAT